MSRGSERGLIARTRSIALGLATVVVGAVVGFALGVVTPTHIEIAGTQAQLTLEFGRASDVVDLSGVLRGERATDRAILGEPIGLGAHLALDAGAFTTSDGSFNVDVLPAYIQAYSDPAQLVHDVRWALFRHVLWFTSSGAVLGLLLVAAVLALRAARRRWDLADPDRVRHRDIAVTYRAPERRLAGRIAGGAALLLIIAAIPASARAPRQADRIVPNPIFAGTPLAGTEVSGVLRPLIEAARSYIQTYFADTDTYYDQLRARLDARLDAGDLQLPTGADGQRVVHIGFVTDRHCNIGMDRVIVALLKHFTITTLVSGGDDDFSGSFPFESACTRNLAAKSQEAGIRDVFVAGNHDSPQTLADERTQRIAVLDGAPVTVGGLTFVGYPDPRASRYGTGIQPASAAARDRLIAAQGARTGALACRSAGPVIVVLHDPTAGADALSSGCGRAVLALDGHTHVQAGPTAVTLPNDAPGYQFVGASSGGAPNESSVERSFAAQLTVGPLNNDATINIITVDRDTGALVAVTVARFTPAQGITFSTLTPGG